MNHRRSTVPAERESKQEQHLDALREGGDKVRSDGGNVMFSQVERRERNVIYSFVDTGFRTQSDNEIEDGIDAIDSPKQQRPRSRKRRQLVRRPLEGAISPSDRDD